MKELNFVARAKKYNISLWEYPPFLFFLIGVIIIGAIIVSYFVGTRYFPPEEVALGIIGITTFLLILNYIIVNSFERLLEANLMKSEFIKIISHQLRTPLSNLKWTLNLALKEKGEDKREEYFKTIKEQNDRMIKLVSDLLSIYQIETGRWALKKEKVNLGENVRKIVEEFTPLAKSNNIKIKVDIEKNLPKILVDSQKIRQVISNLLHNAIYYSKDGEVGLTLKKENRKIRFEVKDRGVGVPREEQRYIFQKFFRSKNILRYKTEGMGLSLFIAKNIIDASGGKIGFKSKEGKGSTFWFELPIR